MKLSLLLCGAILVVAGCASEQSPFASSADIMYTYDAGPQPFPDLTPSELRRINESPRLLFAYPQNQTHFEQENNDR